jgi:hypothetical protein
VKRLTTFAFVVGLFASVVGASAFQPPRWKADVSCAPDGEYRLRIGMKEVGWACTEGSIIVSKKDGSNSKIEITLRLGR